MGCSMILTNNSSSSVVAANGVVPVGSAVHGYGKAIRLNGNAISLNETGYYYVTATVTAAVTGATALTATLYNNSIATPANATATPSEAGAVVDLTIAWVFRKTCCAESSDITIVLDSAATVNDITVVAVKL